MYFPDMGTRTQIAAGPTVRAVGWLDASHRYPTGTLGTAEADRIRSLAGLWLESTEALGWPCAGGAHECELCGTFWAAGNLGVPAGDLLFVCPEMIAHYVATHAYLPPREFLEAVMSAPLPGTEEYRLAVSHFR